MIAIVVAVGVYNSDDEAKTTETTTPATVSPSVEFQRSFQFVKLRVYSCEPCNESQADKAAQTLGESGKVTAHAFFNSSSDFASLESQIAGASSFVEAEQIINSANPKQFRRVMANGTMLNQ